MSPPTGHMEGCGRIGDESTQVYGDAVEYGVAHRPLTPNPPPPPPYSPSGYIAYSPYSPASPHSPHPQNLPPPPPFPPPPRLTPSPAPSYHSHTLQPPHTLPRHRSSPNLRNPEPQLQPRPPVPRADTTLPTTTDPEKPTLYADARHFLGGLIHHPSESTRHYSILRHSHGIVFYRGPSTSVTVSIFADTPLPVDRSLWLQCKGWSGKTGMRAKALFRVHDDWVNVSPSVALRADQVDPNKERAWQRDIAKFLKKASRRIRETHKLRETVVARIPPEAEDGYFQLILCQGEKKVMCRSPVFRILSTSLDPSSLRGASVTTLPLEVGALVAGTYARVMASRVTAPVAAVAGAASSRYRPKWLTDTVVSTAYGAIKGDGSQEEGPSVYAPPLVENGPQPPYPLNFTAKPSQSVDPTRVSVKIPSDIQDKLRGHFFGWARFSSDDDWQMVILSVLLWDGTHATGPVSLAHTTRKSTVLRLLNDSLPHPPPSAVSIRLLGFLRPDVPPPSPRTEYDLQAARQAAAEAAFMADNYDTEYTQAVLDHPMWDPEAAIDQRGWFDKAKEGAENIKTRGQKMVERIGVRSGVEQEYMGGFYIVRG
ncbi:hypothetical protein BJY04DRAFT_206999 [Aspergillus karnatakaensis]|uniref:uncharacterized protein n=1 Tax=Aspergillus karnatakaensis TaxID=1810916 RepID=UPI003CCD51C4